MNNFGTNGPIFHFGTNESWYKWDLTISRDVILIFAEYKNGRNMQNFKIVSDRGLFGTFFIFQGFQIKFNLIEWLLILFKN